MMNHVIIVAGGVGSRMNSDIPKQFMDLDGIPVIVRTIRRFLEWSENVGLIVVVHSDYSSVWMGIKEKYFSHYNIHWTTGGETRFHSVKNGLELIDQEGIVGVHDAARPLVSLEVIDKCFSEAKDKKACIPVFPVYESMRRINKTNSEHIDRKEYVLVQTPQCFRSELIKKAYSQQYSPLFTDDASVVEKYGEVVHLVEGNKENIKITEPSDLKIAASLIIR